MNQTVDVECRRCSRSFSYPVMPEDTVAQLMRRIALVHRQSSQECGRRYGASGLLIKHFDSTAPLFPVPTTKEAA